MCKNVAWFTTSIVKSFIINILYFVTLPPEFLNPNAHSNILKFEKLAKDNTNKTNLAFWVEFWVGKFISRVCSLLYSFSSNDRLLYITENNVNIRSFSILDSSLTFCFRNIWQKRRMNSRKAKCCYFYAVVCFFLFSLTMVWNELKWISGDSHSRPQLVWEWSLLVFCFVLSLY